MLSGGIGGLCGNPADVVNIRMQADGRLPLAERRNYKNAFGIHLPSKTHTTFQQSD